MNSSIGLDPPDSPDQPQEPQPKNVSVSHLLPYDPFSPHIPDTAPAWLRCRSSDLPVYHNPKRPIQAGDFCIIPAWAWDADLTREELPFGVGVVTKVDRATNTLEFHRYGNYPYQLEGPFKPGWVDKRPDKHGSRKHTYRKVAKPNHIPYTNNMSDKNWTAYYPVILDQFEKSSWYGFSLTEDHHLPDDVLNSIREDPYIHYP